MSYFGKALSSSATYLTSQVGFNLWCNLLTSVVCVVCMWVNVVCMCVNVVCMCVNVVCMCMHVFHISGN